MAYSTKKDFIEQSNTWMLDLTRQILTQIERHIQPVRNRLEIEVGPFNDADAHLAEIAISMAPEALGLAHIYQCVPYVNPNLIRQEFTDAVRRGWLTISAEGAHQATEKSFRFHKRLDHEIRMMYNALRPLPIMQLERLDKILTEIITAIDGSQLVTYKPSFDMDCRLAPKASSTLQKICRKLSHLLAYRDDAYINAWMDKEINSYVWETFSYIYKGQAQTAASLAKKLGMQRQYGIDTYKAALSELEDRNWITSCNNRYEPTTEGLMVLSEVARTMMKNFFEPWADLGEAKMDQLKILLEALVQGLQSPQVKRWTAQTGTAQSFSWRSAQWVRDKVR